MKTYTVTVRVVIDNPRELYFAAARMLRKNLWPPSEIAEHIGTDLKPNVEACLAVWLDCGPHPPGALIAETKAQLQKAM